MAKPQASLFLLSNKTRDPSPVPVKDIHRLIKQWNWGSLRGLLTTSFFWTRPRAARRAQPSLRTTSLTGLWVSSAFLLAVLHTLLSISLGQGVFIVGTKLCDRKQSSCSSPKGSARERWVLPLGNTPIRFCKLAAPGWRAGPLHVLLGKRWIGRATLKDNRGQYSLKSRNIHGLAQQLRFSVFIPKCTQGGVDQDAHWSRR